MDKFARNLITEWRKLELPFAEQNAVIAVSGGADSVSLALAIHQLFKLKKLKLNFIIAHFNHKLRGAESNADEEFVRNLAAALQFDFVCGRPKIKIQEQKENLEQAARIARYDFLKETATEKNARLVLTAHTLNDQAETFLFNLLRGSGAQGLSAMKAKRSLESNEASQESSLESQMKLIRPLLNWAQREDTQRYCLENNVEFRQDAMNEQTKFTRVRIRKELIPFLRTFNPKIIETLARTANLLGTDTACVPGIIEEISAELSIKSLKELPEAVRLKLLRNWLKSNRGDLRRLEAIHIEAIDRLILSTKSGRIVELPGDEQVVKSGGKLRFEAKKVEKRPYAN